MNLTSLILLTLKASIVLTVFGLGLRATRQNATDLFRKPELLLRSLVSMNVVMPLLAGVMVAAFHLHPAVEIALVALSISPVPPILPKKQLKAGAETAYSFGLLVTAAVTAIVFIPIGLEVFGRALGVEAHMSPGPIALLVLKTVLAPLAAGILVREMAPAAAARIVKPLGRIAAVLLALGVLSVLFTAMPAIVSLIGNGTLLAITAFTSLGLVAGHLLGGPKPDDRTALALATASRHPGVAIAIAQANFPKQKLAAAAILLYLIVNAVLSIPYLRWRRRQAAAAGLPVAGHPQNARRTGT